MEFRDQVKAALNELGVPQSDDWDTIEEVARERMSDERIDEFAEADPEERLALVLADFPAATTFAIGFRRSEFESVVPWCMNQVKDSSDLKESVIVDLGAGAGFTAAMMSRVSGRRVIATEVIDAALPVISEVAARLAANVEAVSGGIEDLASLMSMYAADTLVIQRVLPYLDLPHQHRPGFSWVEAVRTQYQNPELRGTAVEQLFRGAYGVSQVLIVDLMCAEKWAALVAIACEHGFELDPMRSQRLTIPDSDGSTAMHAFRFMQSKTPRLIDPMHLTDLVEGFKRAPGPRWMHSDFDIFGWAAERLTMDFDVDGEWYRAQSGGPHQGNLLIGLFETREGVWAFTACDDGNRVLRLEAESMRDARASLTAKHPRLEPVDTPAVGGYEDS